MDLVKTLIGYKSTHLPLSNAPKITKIFNKLQEISQFEGPGSLFITKIFNKLQEISQFEGPGLRLPYIYMYHAVYEKRVTKTAIGYWCTYSNPNRNGTLFPINPYHPTELSNETTGF